MMQSIIWISTNHIIQLNQISRAYQAKTALNMAETILIDELKSEGAPVKSAELTSTIGKIIVIKDTNESYQLSLIIETGENYTKDIQIDDLLKIDDNTEDSEANSSLFLEKENEEERILTK